jgi:hypothetical protein
MKEAHMALKRSLFLMTLGALLLIGALGLLLLPTGTASAQCGSQASSCKNCHEVQAQDPVNNDGTGWHQSHAFGDFCEFCHAGNVQATDKDAAHTGMVAPLADVQASCSSCHAQDLDARAKVYAAALGVDYGTGGGAAPVPPASSASTPAPAASDPAPAANNVTAPAYTDLAVDDPNLVDYAQRYDEIVLGKHPTNWGNVILMVMIGLVLVGGGGFVIANEKLVNVSFGDTKKAEGEYPADVVDMLPDIASLKTNTRKSLKRVLGNPKKADKVLGLIDAVVSDEETEE